MLHPRPRAGAVDVDAYLRVPAHGTPPYPVVVMSLGSLGMASGREELYADAFARAGVATLVVDSFGSRGVAETFSDQGRISLATSCADALAGLRFAAGDPRCDPGRIALLGYSRGGCAVVLCDDERLHRAGGTAARFAAYVALYPSVWLRWEHPRPTRAPVLFVLGGRDVMAPLAIAQQRAQALAAAGAPVETVVLAEAQHSFDALGPATEKPNETNMSVCDVVIGDDGGMRELGSGITFAGDWAAFVRRLREERAARGGTTGWGPLPRDVADAPSLAFLERAR